MERFLLPIAILIFGISFSQTKRVLIYHETNGFRHSSINTGISMIQTQGVQNGLWDSEDIDQSDNSNVFTTANLAQYDAVIFLNTSGSDESGNDGDLLSATEKSAFENFIINGGGFVGIHAATDTYRDGNWSFYNELVGGIVQVAPNHTNSDFNATMTIKNAHPAVNFLGPVGNTWNKNEEYYYWELNGGQLSSDNTVLLEVESTGNNSYDAARPISWFKESITVDGTTFNNIKSFYTALGHNESDYSNDSNFQSHIEEAIKWAIGEATLNINEVSIIDGFKIFPNPFKDKLSLQLNFALEDTAIKVYSILGKLVHEELILVSSKQNANHTIDLSALQSGVYLLYIKTKKTSKILKIVKL